MRYVFYLLYSLPAVALAADQTPIHSGDNVLELVLKALGLFGTAIMAIIQILGFNLGRASLKADLEILKQLDFNDSNYQTVKATVDEQIRQIYGPKPPRDWVAALIGLLWALGFSYWTFKILVNPVFTWWVLITGYQALAGLTFIFMAVTGTRLAGKWRHKQSGVADPKGR